MRTLRNSSLLRPKPAPAFRLLGLLLSLSILILGLSITVAGAQQPEEAPGERLVSVGVMEEGGLFLPSTEPGFVVPAVTVGATIDVAVNGPVARTTIRQTFVNPTDRWVEGVYVYPLPEDATVDRLRMIFEDHVVEGRVERKEVAEQAYQEALEAGQQASLVTQERPNLFTNSVANIPPHEAMTIEIQFQEVLRYADGAFQLRLPMAITPRYLPGDEIGLGAGGTGWGPDTDQVADGSRITPPIADPAFGPINEVRMTVTLDAGFPVAGVESASHPIETAKEAEGRYRVEVAKESIFADRDFLLTWRPQATTEAYAALLSERVGGQDYHLVMLTPPAADSLPAEPPAREIVFIIDTSGSMSGDSIHQARQSLLWALDRLRPEDHFNVIEFNSDARALFDDAVGASEQNLRTARGFVRGLVADGGTEMRTALEMALDGSVETGRIRQVVFITDGAVGNEAELFGLIDRRLGDSRLFTVGIGSAPNSHFMREAATAGRGSYTFIGDPQQVGDRMEALFEKLEHPAVTDIEVAWPEDGGSRSGVEVYPPVVPDLYAGEPVVLAARVPAGTAGPLTISGRVGQEAWSETLALEPAASAEEGGAAGIAKLWGRDKIAALERELAYGGSAESIDAEITQVALDLQIVSRLTSLVAVDDRVVRPETEETETEAVAGNLPHGNTMMAEADPARPASIDAIRSMAKTGSPFAASLPPTAIGRELQVAFGALLILAAMALLVLARRRTAG